VNHIYLRYTWDGKQLNASAQPFARHNQDNYGARFIRAKQNKSCDDDYDDEQNQLNPRMIGVHFGLWFVYWFINYDLMLVVYSFLIMNAVFVAFPFIRWQGQCVESLNLFMGLSYKTCSSRRKPPKFQKKRRKLLVSGQSTEHNKLFIVYWRWTENCYNSHVFLLHIVKTYLFWVGSIDSLFQHSNNCLDSNK
jgi:hypothetical protein